MSPTPREGVAQQLDAKKSRNGKERAVEFADDIRPATERVNSNGGGELSGRS